MNEEPKNENAGALESSNIMERQIKEVKDKEIEDYEKEILELEQELKLQQEGKLDPYLDSLLENEFQEIRRILIEKDKQCQKADVQVAFHTQQLQQKAKDLMSSVKNDNHFLGEYVQSEYKDLLEQETKGVTEKVKKLRQTLNSLNDDIKNLEKEHLSHVDDLSSVKRLVNEERKKRDKLKDEIAMYHRDK